MSLSNPKLPVTEERLQEFYHKILPYLGGSDPTTTILTQTLTEGSTTVTFTNIPTEGDYLIDFYTSNGISHTAMDTSTEGQVTLTFKPQESDITVFCEIKEVQV